MTVMLKNAIKYRIQDLQITNICYTSKQQDEAYNSGATQRIIRIVEIPVDPIDSSTKKFGLSLPLAPILHSLLCKISAKEQQKWIIPPSTEGRGLQEVTINDKFAKFSEALFIANRHARKEAQQYALMREKFAQKEKEEKERC
ncbi:hypothetical protein C2G38_2203394 [Gigaspora rosea]|uniref:Pre-mRNA-processing protein 45 n=1 Tax=Gigaspora rosea TaxID=44941 RepID=A0A397UQ59_9GLOM|nr:hypothetical protein C2G38_2203394 [Gigaspora rosea]